MRGGRVRSGDDDRSLRHLPAALHRGGEQEGDSGGDSERRGGGAHEEKNKSPQGLKRVHEIDDNLFDFVEKCLLPSVGPFGE